MKFKKTSLKPGVNFVLCFAPILYFLTCTYCFSPKFTTNSLFNPNLSIAFSLSTPLSHYSNEGNGGNVSEFSSLHSFRSGSATNELQCGEIVYGTPLKRNQDGTIMVDIGLPQTLIASKSTLYFMNEDEHYRLNNLLSAAERDKTQINMRQKMIYDTIHTSKKFPERKRKTYFKPKYPYPYDYLKSLRKKERYIPFDIGVGAEIRPQDFSVPSEKKTPEFLKNLDRMEFLVTDINPYSNYIYGEFFSVNIVETKRKTYSLMHLDSLNKKYHFVPYEGIVTDIMDNVLKVSLTNCRRSEMYGVNAYTLTTGNDKIGDKIQVYLAGSEVVPEQVYLFRSQISHPILRRENLNMLINSIIKYYARTGKWFKAEVDKVYQDFLSFRLSGGYKEEYLAYITKEHLPYNYPEELLNESFIRINKPHRYFVQKDIEINFGKLNHIYHYDNSIYVRGNELSVKNVYQPISQVDPISNLMMFTTTKNYYKPTPTMEKYFLKICTNVMCRIRQDSDKYEIKKDLTYPCIVIGNDRGLVYFAINDKFKPNFTLNDDYLIGVMDAGQYSTNVEIGRIVHVKLGSIEKYRLEGVYAVQQRRRDERYVTMPITEWLSNLTEKELRTHKINLKELELKILVMSNFIYPSSDSPQMNEFLTLQPVFAENHFADDLESEDIADTILSRDLSQDSFFLNDPEEEMYPSIKELSMERELGYVVLKERTIFETDYFLHNEELREIFLKENMDPKAYRKLLRNIECAKYDPPCLVQEFFVNSKNEPFWEFLERLMSQTERRKITLKEALEFERSIMRLLSQSHKLYLERIYDMLPKEAAMFSSIVPNSYENTFYSLGELIKYYDAVRHDYIMDRSVSKSILRVLKILTHPNYSLMSLLRERHRKILNDVFFYFSKSLNYDSYMSLNRPVVLRNQERTEIPIAIDEEDASSIPMAPYTEIIKNPRILTNELQVYGLSMIRKMYSDLLRLNDPFKSKYIKPSHVDDSVEDIDFGPDDLSDLEPEARRMFRDVDINEYALNNLDGSKMSLKELSKAWKRLNRYPKDVSLQDLREYLEDMQKVNRVHGIKLPII
ncbi:uncharacterized protein TA10230 [Theileria annulata]|uniref:Uncharacterized protein n=1 Tax=Theileria annulata TaxID=5874 RepID=Q4U8V2_THEAN|nr:uncharacterized protein TA10230 [Theileria annulata]CAI76751.1 hypothetical protein TA10230 [Theileria annulata]|eukprot:XP_953376.1 hypothetical protein TA10230 [Theileria annulata]